jgi:hypothetical protein
MAVVRRTLGTVLLGFLLAAVAPAAPASAHTVGGASPTNLRSEITRVTPPLHGVEVNVVEAGNRLELVNTSAADVVVAVYQGEPYLRVGPSGVFENVHSPATYLNRTRKGGTVLPPRADATAAPNSV